MDVVDELHARGQTVIVVTHEDHIAAHARRVIRLRDGMIEQDEVRPAAA
jgi:putative ABC transport system ATP-binding protein